MNKLKLRKPNRVVLATIKGSNNSSQTVFIKDYTSEGHRNKHEYL